MDLTLKRLLPIAFVALALTVMVRLPASADTAPASQVCGTVDLGTTSNADAVKSFDCFNDAFKGCRPASLVATGYDGSMPVTWTFSTSDGDYGCRVLEIVERGSGGAKTTDTFLCSGISRDSAQLSFSGCGTQRQVTLRLGQAEAAKALSNPAQ